MRLAPGRELPAYAYVPGRWPHPYRHAGGHSFGHTDAAFGPPPTDSTWPDHEPYRYVLDLFNGGYYWEAHEGFEKWWRESREYELRRAFFQGLVRLCAAGVKAREGRQVGVERHAARASELIGRVGDAVSGEAPHLLGLDLRMIAGAATAIGARASELVAAAEGVDTATPVLPLRLVPRA